MITDNMTTQEFYLFRVRDPINGKWGQTRYKVTEDIARKRFGEGCYERIEASREVRTGYAEGVALDEYAESNHSG
jgi:hypothetical protein